MGLFDDIFEIVKDADDLKNDVIKEFNDIGSEIKESTDDISYGAKKIHHDTNDYVKKKLSIDGFKKHDNTASDKPGVRKDP